MAGTRNNAIKNDPIILQIQFRKNSAKFEPLSWDKVEIYETREKAIAGLPADVLETIVTGDISSDSNGLATYTIAGLPNAQTYFDKIFITPETNIAQMIFINPLFVHQDSFGASAPGAKETARILLNLSDIQDNPQKGDKVQVTMGNRFGVYTNSLIEREVEEFTADVDGVVEMILVETTTMTEDSGETIFYELTALNGIYRRLFTVPKGTIDINFFDLPEHIPS